LFIRGREMGIPLREDAGSRIALLTSCQPQVQENAMPVTSEDTVAQRARSALGMPTSYWLGQGGWQGAGRPDEPGTPFDPVRTLAALLEPGRPAADRERHARYTAGLAQAGLAPASLPRVACDCSGFVYWALQLQRGGANPPVPELNTTAMWDDASDPAKRRFLVPADGPSEGAMLVYPKSAPDDFGHVGILVRDAQGGFEVIHCDAHNYLLPPAPGAARNSIAQTGTAKFDANPRTLVVRWKALVR
jgi:cell wall-associated NlpC family hydrolase